VSEYSEGDLFPKEAIISRVLIIRELKVMIDSDLAELYGVSTKRLNEQVKRNIKRFPKDFMFQLSEAEKEEVVAICDHLCFFFSSFHSPQTSPILSFIFFSKISISFLFAPTSSRSDSISATIFS